MLLNIALHGTAAHVERTVQQYRRVERIEKSGRAAAAQQNRFFDVRFDNDDSAVIHGRVPAEVGELIRAAIECAMDQDPVTDASAESSSDAERAVPEDARPLSARRADALRAIAAQFLTRADSAAAADDKPHLCEFEDAQALAVETARRLARDGGCGFPGCHHTRFTEGHHIRHWANGGETKLSNLITLCHFHHHLMHEGGFRVVRTDDGLFVFQQPDGASLRTDFAVAGRFRGSALAIDGLLRSRIRTVRSGQSEARQRQV